MSLTSKVWTLTMAEVVPGEGPTSCSATCESSCISAGEVCWSAGLVAGSWSCCSEVFGLDSCCGVSPPFSITGEVLCSDVRAPSSASSGSMKHNDVSCRQQSKERAAISGLTPAAYHDLNEACVLNVLTMHVTASAACGVSIDARHQAPRDQKGRLHLRRMLGY
jgi:hypothetical protein